MAKKINSYKCIRCGRSMGRTLQYANYPRQHKRTGEYYYVGLCKTCNETHTFDKTGVVVTWAEFSRQHQQSVLEFQLKQVQKELRKPIDSEDTP